MIITQQNVYYDNAVASAANYYTYDALYCLIQAKGREHAGGNVATSYNDTARIGIAPLTADASAMRRYIQYYEYDEVGNMLQMKHTTTGGTGNWTRNFDIDTASNRLTGNSIGSDTTGTETYTYDARGNMVTGLNHLTGMAYNDENRLEVVVDASGDITSYYQYDYAGQRVRKTVVNTNNTTTKMRKYFLQWELYLEYKTGTSMVSLERETLHIMDGTNRVAFIDTPIIVPHGSGEVQLLRYQFSNHLSTASLELDVSAAIISYEEYYPYGNTSFQCGRSGAEVSLKRYRYAGKERDEETGFNYHGARYYIPWLARWAAVDPKSSETPTWSPYRYCFDNPIKLVDNDGQREYKNYKEYQTQMNEQGRSKEILPYHQMGTQGNWLTSDRVNRTPVWNNAAEYITRNESKNELKPFAEIRDYYLWAQSHSEAKGHEIMWGRGAVMLVNDLADAFQEGSITTGNWEIADLNESTKDLLKELNVKIAGYAITKYNDLLYGKDSKVPLKGAEAVRYDFDFIKNEQGSKVAYPAYLVAATNNPIAIKQIDAMVRKEGLLGYSVAMAATGYIPAFSDFMDSHFSKNND